MKLFTSRFPIILASASPRRQKYLDDLGLSYSVLAPTTPEEIDNNQKPCQNAMKIASEKAHAVLSSFECQCTNAIIIAADTLVVLDKLNSSYDLRYIPCFNKESFFHGDMNIDNLSFDANSAKNVNDLNNPSYVNNSELKDMDNAQRFEILGKPKTEEEAFEMLKKLSGNKHRVITAVSIILPDKKEILFYDQTEVYFQNFTDSVLRRYAQSGEGLDKAGAYAIQGHGGFLVQRIEGALSTVVGLPVHLLLQQLLEKNVLV